MNGDVKPVYALYRACLRQIRRLPTEYLRQFFRLKVRDDVRAIVDPRSQHLQPTKIRRVQKDLQKLQGANAGFAKSFAYVLDTAYGRRGPLRWEILDPLRSEPGAPLPPRIIPAVESSRPPVYSREMRALFMSDSSRTTKTFTAAELDHPPIFPPRANPESPEARALGPFSKRREVNLRRRFFQQELQRTHFPLQVAVEEAPTSGGSASRRTDADALARVGVRPVGLQDSGVFEEIEAIASPPSALRHSSSGDACTEHSRPSVRSHLPTRFLRRRYQQLLSRIPVLVFKPPRQSAWGSQPGKFQVTLSPKAGKRSAIANRLATEADLAWIQRAQEIRSDKSKK